MAAVNGMAQDSQPKHAERERILQWLAEAGRDWRATAEARRHAPIHFSHEVRLCEDAARQCEETARLLRDATAQLDRLSQESRRLRDELDRAMARLSEAGRWVDVLTQRIRQAASETDAGAAATSQAPIDPATEFAPIPASDRIVVRCSACSAKLSLPAGRSGRVRCPVCQTLFEAQT